ncbi:succinyl-diaminopimelate desuccinylase [Halorubrum ezzemoulense]|uniref:Succinyl-diaminopimelate desuccinylase n=1 Tax=Halorubrum ezzemoulense TaxID=337243 RepID=A0A238WHF2_HALEZ|nr:M20/M25/M40 family metallo-hydrolase [Halorubrum ezzemoulense]MDB2240305.1 M20/M25/M40 family metallo-hydrolase [Halorubrum ezzemoulense]SNR45888.1 succinyl-diaminopimelate desuccinylase [Halorubrum ezzemoulense]
MSEPRAPEPVERFLADNRADLVETAEVLLGHDTANPPGHTATAASWIASRLEGAGVDVERIAVDPEKPNLVATLPGVADRTLCLVGHLDTVPFDASEWSRDPLGERDGGRLYGRGATDMKGAVAAMAHVALAYAETDAAPPVDLQFAFVSDEETGGDAGLPSVREAIEFVPDACVIGETTSRDGRCAVSIADRGAIWLTLEATGEAAHGSRPMLGINAIDRLTAAIDRLKREFGTRELDVAPEMEPVVEESVGFHGEELDAETVRDLFRYPTVNLGVIEGGSAVNTVPASARAEIDIRLTATVETHDALGSIRRCLGGIEGISVADVSWSRGSYEPIDSPLVEASTAAAESVVEGRIYRRSATGGGDAKDLRHDGIPTVEFGFGTDTAHAVDEYTTVDALVRNAKAYARLVGEFAARVDDGTAGSDDR